MKSRSRLRRRSLPLGVASLLCSSAFAADPPSVPAPEMKAGDSWTFDRSTERGTGGFAEQRLDFKIEHVGGDTMVVGLKLHGSPVDFEDHLVGSDWSQHRIIDGKQMITGQPFSFPLTVGKTWTLDWVDSSRHGLQVSATHHEIYKITGWEDVTTPAGTFHAIKIEGDDKVKADFMAASAAAGGTVATTDGATVVAQSGRSGPHSAYQENLTTNDYAPQIKYWVKSTEDEYNSDSVRIFRKTDILVSFTPAP